MISNDYILDLQERIKVLERLNRDLILQNKDLIKESKRKDDLLAAIPVPTIDPIKAKKGRFTYRYNMISVLYTNVSGLTSIAASNEAETHIDELDRIYFHFDTIIKQFNIEKIRSIGDSYICAGGIPNKNRTNPIELVMAAIEMQHYLTEYKDRSEKKNMNLLDINFGIHTGPAVVSVTGTNKKLYDISGDTINIASRIESTSELSRIHISESTYEITKEFFICEYRGKVPVRYKGEVLIYSVKGYRPELSINAKGKIPNELFWAKLQMVRFEDVSTFILDKLEQELPKYLYYHDLKHTIDVTIGVEIIGTGEGLTENDILLLKTAALFHDYGQISGNENHELRSCEAAREILPVYGYNNQQIEIVEQLIMATRHGYLPQNKMEEIICDADLDYLGRGDFIPVSENLFYELKYQNLVGSIHEWNVKQMNYLQSHQFYTDTARSLRQVGKEKQIDRLKKLIEQNADKSN